MGTRTAAGPTIATNAGTTGLFRTKTMGLMTCSQPRRRVPRPRRAGFAADLGAEALQVGNPHHRQPEAVGPLDHAVHVMLRRRDVVPLDVQPLVGLRHDGLTLAQRRNS